MVIRVSRLADKYAAESVISRCKAYFSFLKSDLRSVNVARLLVDAKAYDVADLLDPTLDYVKKY